MEEQEAIKPRVIPSTTLFTWEFLVPVAAAVFWRSQHGKCVHENGTDCQGWPECIIIILMNEIIMQQKRYYENTHGKNSTRIGQNLQTLICHIPESQRILLPVCKYMSRKYQLASLISFDQSRFVVVEAIKCTWPHYCMMWFFCLTF